MTLKDALAVDERVHEAIFAEYLNITFEKGLSIPKSNIRRLQIYQSFASLLHQTSAAVIESKCSRATLLSVLYAARNGQSDHETENIFYEFGDDTDKNHGYALTLLAILSRDKSHEGLLNSIDQFDRDMKVQMARNLAKVEPPCKDLICGLLQVYFKIENNSMLSLSSILAKC